MAEYDASGQRLVVGFYFCKLRSAKLSLCRLPVVGAQRSGVCVQLHDVRRQGQHSPAAEVVQLRNGDAVSFRITLRRIRVVQHLVTYERQHDSYADRIDVGFVSDRTYYGIRRQRKPGSRDHIQGQRATRVRKLLESGSIYQNATDIMSVAFSFGENCEYRELELNALLTAQIG